jgi:hypothetical protein
MKVLTYNQYRIAEDLCEFIANPIINESDNKDSQINGVLKKLSQDLKFNYGLVFTFGVGVRVMYPIVEGLIKNGTLNIEPTTENIILVSIAALTITYLEESKNKAGDSEVPCDCKDKPKNCDICGGTGMVKSIVTKQDARTILEELKLRGIGNGIIKKMVECFKFLGSIFKSLFRNTPYVVNGLIDMLAYTSILIPAMNGISAIVGKYDLTIDTLIGNAAAISLGIMTFLTKYGFDWLVKKFKNKFGFDTKNLDVPTVVKPFDIIDTEDDNLGDNKLIKEQ